MNTILAILALWLCAAHAGDWPQYKRDAARSGNAPEEALEFPMERVVAVRFPSPIYASPAVVAGRIYIQDAHGHVACVDAARNQVLWVTPIGGVANLSSPAVGKDKVYVGSSVGHLAILDAATGKLLNKVPGPGGVITAPALTDEAVYFSTFDGKLIKIDFDGKVLWTFDKGLASYAEFAVRGKDILFHTRIGGDSLLCLLEDGGASVTLKKSTGGYPPTSGPVFGNGPFAARQAFDSEWGRWFIWSWDGASEVKNFEHKEIHDTRATPSVRGDRFYRGDICTTARGELVWKAEHASLSAGGFHSSPALGKDHLVLGGEEGTVFFLPVEPATYAPVKFKGGKPVLQKCAWTYSVERAGKPNSAVSSSPALSDGRVYFGGEDGVLYGLGKGTPAVVVEAVPPGEPYAWPGRKLEGPEWRTPGGDCGYSFVSPDTSLRPPLEVHWKTRVWSSFKVPPVVAEGKVFAAGRLGQMTALDAETGEIIWRTYHPRGESRASAIYDDGKVLVLRSAFNENRKPANQHGGIWCHDAATGDVVWRKELPVGYHDNADGLVSHQGKVFAWWREKGMQVAAYALADGKELWKRTFEYEHASPSRDLRGCGVVGDGVLFCSFPETDKSAGLTVAMNPETGEPLWTTEARAIENRSRIAFRNGTLVVFNLDGGHALDPKTGAELWTGKGLLSKTIYGGKLYYMHALTDAYLESKGQKGLVPVSGCMLHVFVNGVWYGHDAGSNHRMVGRSDNSGIKQVWKYDFLSRACPAPAPAYGRLYYAPNGEGILYCFKNAAK